MNSGDATAADETLFAAWLAADPVHRREYEKLGGLWTELDALPDPRPMRVPPAARGLSRRQVFLGGLAVVGVAAVAAPLTGVATVLAADFSTATGERKTVIASDGTHIELDAGTAIAEDYTSAVRRLCLLEGRAAFAVADDPERPFEVLCQRGICRTAKASFVVHRRAEDVSVIVEAAKVSVVLEGGSEGGVITVLQADQSIAYTTRRLGAVEPVSGDIDTAWRRGKLVFRDRPLNDVVADLNRYREGRIVIADRSLAAVRLDGIFDIAKPEAALEAMINTLPLQAWRITDYLIVLRRA